jgi:predicted amidohydrolase YtcJ
MKLLINARIHTLDPVQPVVSVLALDGGRIVAAGGDELLGEFDGSAREDLRGRVVLPGLTDAHIHLQELALSRSIIQCEGLSIDEIRARVAQKGKQVDPSLWVRGHGWNQNDWGGAWPAAADLSEAAPATPCYLTAKSLHAAWVNRRALELAGITASTPDPLNGQIQRGLNGEPTGLLFENAMQLVEKIIPEPSPEDLARQFQSLELDLWKCGLTGVHDFDRRTCFQALQLLHERGELHLRVLKSIPQSLLSHAAELGLRTGFGDDFLHIGPVKLFADGALGPHTGAMFEPYVDEPQNRGILLLDNEQLFEIGRVAVENGLSLAVHAIGDRAVHEVLDGFARLREYESVSGLPPMRHRIEHVQTIRPQDAGRLADLGLIASMQPVHALSDMLMADSALGDRAAWSYAWRTQLDHGAHLAFGSDAPVEQPNPFHGLYAAVTRRRRDDTPSEQGWYPRQRLSVQEALEAFTLGPAYAAGMENDLGRLSPGYLADLIVLPGDPFTCDPADLYDLKPDSVMVGGNWVWQS